MDTRGIGGGASEPCSIIDWVNSNHKTFGQALSDLCLADMIGSGVMARMNPNTTFIMPSKDIQDQIIEAAKKDTDASALFASFIIPLSLPTADAFVEAHRTSGVGNLRGHKFGSVTKSGSGVVVDGVTLKLATGFKARRGVAIWVAEGSAAALAAAPGEHKWSGRAAMRKLRSTPKGVDGGAADAGHRAKVRSGASMLRAKFLEGLAAGVLGARQPVVTVLDAYSSDPYLSFCHCLFAELRSAGQLETVRSRGLLDYSPLVTFELIARPGFESGEFDGAVAAAFDKFASGASATATVDAFIAEVGTGGADLSAYLDARDDAGAAACGRIADLKRAYGDKAEALWADTVREAYGNYLYDLLRSTFGPGEVVELPLASAPRNTGYESFVTAFFAGSGLVRGDESAAVHRFVASSDFKHDRLSAAGAREAIAKLAKGDREFVESLVQDAGEWQRDLFTLHTLAVLEPRLGARAAHAIRGAADTIKQALRASKRGAGTFGGGASFLGGAQAALDDIVDFAKGGC